MPVGGGNLNRGVFGNGQFVITVNNTTYGVYTSPDASTWTLRAGPAHFYDIDFGDGLHIVHGWNHEFFSSTDGITWTSRYAPGVGGFSGTGPRYGGSQNEPDAFTFTDQTGVATSTVINSNIVTVNNFTGPLYVFAGATADVDVCVNDGDSNLSNGLE